MDVLIRFGFSIEEIKNMMDTNIDIDNINDEILMKLIAILKDNGCSDLKIKNILLANPFYLSKSVEGMENLVEAMKGIGLDYLEMIFESNPFILNMEKEDFVELVDKKKKEGFNEAEIKSFICYDLI